VPAFAPRHYAKPGGARKIAAHSRRRVSIGQRALAIARSTTPPDLMLLDVMMPDLDGYEHAYPVSTQAHYQL
jgi:CheY-like chemotaxis protein